MNRTKTDSAAIMLSLTGGVLNLLISVIRLPDFSWALTSLSGLVTILAAIFLYWAPHKRTIWGGIIFLYSNVGFIAFGVSPEMQLLPYGFAALTLGVITAALIICEK